MGASTRSVDPLRVVGHSIGCGEGDTLVIDHVLQDKSGSTPRHAATPTAPPIERWSAPASLARQRLHLDIRRVSPAGAVEFTARVCPCNELMEFVVPRTPVRHPAGIENVYKKKGTAGDAPQK